MSTTTHAPSLHIHKDCPHTTYNHPSGGDPILLAQDVATGNATLKRAAECYNALAGIPDPAAALQAAREALEQIDQCIRKEHGCTEKFKNEGYLDQNPLKLEINFRTCRQLLKALSLLTPTKP